MFDFVQEGDEIAERESLKVAYIESDLLSLFIIRFAEREGLFEKHDLDVEIIPVNNFAHELLLTGQTDILVGPTTLISFYYLPSVNMRWLGNLAGHYSGFIVSRYEESNVANIAKVGIAREESLDNFRIRMMFRSLNIDPDEMETVSDLGDAFKAEMMRLGEIDIAIIERLDIAQRLEVSGFYIWNMENFRKDINYSAPHILTLQERINEKESAIQNFVTASYEAVELAKTDEEAVLRIMMDEMMINRETARAGYQQYIIAFEEKDHIPTLEKINSVLPFVFEIDKLFRVQKDPEGLLFPEFAQRAVDILGID